MTPTAGVTAAHNWPICGVAGLSTLRDGRSAQRALPMSEQRRAVRHSSSGTGLSPSNSCLGRPDRASLPPEGPSNQPPLNAPSCHFLNLPPPSEFSCVSEQVIAVSEVAEPSGVDAPSAKRWWILSVVGLAQLMVVLDATIVNIALPSAQKALVFSNADRQWVVTAYSLAFGGLLLLGGRLADLVGRRRMLIIGLIGFAAASALGGASTGFAMLVIGRGLQGAFGAMLAPAALSTLTTTFTDPAERGKAFGVYGAIAGAGGAVGLLLGGALTEYFTWRWCLYVNVVLAVIAVAGAARLLERHPRDPDVHVDWPGTTLVVVGALLPLGV